MQLNTLEWAKGLRSSLLAEVDRAMARGLQSAQDTERVVTFRLMIVQVDTLIAELEAEQAAILPVGPKRP